MNREEFILNAIIKDEFAISPIPTEWEDLLLNCPKEVELGFIDGRDSAIFFINIPALGVVKDFNISIDTDKNSINFKLKK